MILVVQFTKSRFKFFQKKPKKSPTEKPKKSPTEKPKKSPTEKPKKSPTEKVGDKGEAGNFEMMKMNIRRRLEEVITGF